MYDFLYYKNESIYFQFTWTYMENIKTNSRTHESLTVKFWYIYYHAKNNNFAPSDTWTPSILWNNGKITAPWGRIF
jgi:hypothetical protein